MTPRSGARNSGPLTQQTESHLHIICIQCKLNKKLEDNKKTAGVLLSFASIMEISKEEKGEKHLKRSGVRIHCCNPVLIFPVQGSQFKASSPRFSSGSQRKKPEIQYGCRLLPTLSPLFNVSLYTRCFSVLTRPNRHVRRRYQLVARDANHNNGGVHLLFKFTPSSFSTGM